jgi:acyl-CoA thioester hydrolase
MYSNKFEIRVRYPETDRMGIVYHANYVIWFDCARTEFLRSLGYNYRLLEEKGLWLPVLEVNCFYKNPALYDDLITVTATLEELSRVKMKFKYTVTRDDKLLAEGYSKHGFTNPSLKPIALDKFDLDLYEKLKSCL